jgi:hypothetical protein
LRQAIAAATHNVYVGVACVALATLAIVCCTPRRFPVMTDASGARKPA